MKTIEELLANYVSKGLTINQAENCVCQEIILNKIAKSPMADSVLIKGGVVMFNITNNLRRVTTDLDFDFIRYDISNESIKLFFNLLNKYDQNCIVSIDKLEPLHQEDYQGKRVWTIISDKTTKIKFKLDIGVHTLLAIEQDSICFSFDGERKVVLKVNPPEQMFSEKLYSLAKHGPLSFRYKDIFDMYYFIDKRLLNKTKVKQCLELLILNKINGINTLEDICENVSLTFEDKQFIENLKTTKEKWLDISYDVMLKKILDFIFSL